MGRIRSTSRPRGGRCWASASPFTGGGVAPSRYVGPHVSPIVGLAEAVGEGVVLLFENLHQRGDGGPCSEPQFSQRSHGLAANLLVLISLKSCRQAGNCRRGRSDSSESLRRSLSDSCLAVLQSHQERQPAFLIVADQQDAILVSERRIGKRRNRTAASLRGSCSAAMSSSDWPWAAQPAAVGRNRPPRPRGRARGHPYQGGVLRSPLSPPRGD